MGLIGGEMNLGAQLALRVEAPVSKVVAPAIVGSIQRRPDGKIVFRDVVASTGIRVVDNGKQTLILRPGLRLPTGGIAEGLVFSPLSTASVDPWLAVDLVVGADWLFVSTLQGQAPLYAGWDERRQGAYGRLDFQVARRVGGAGIVRAGVSSIGRVKDDRGQGQFYEIAAVAGTTWEAHQRVSIGGSLRVPVLMGPTRSYDVGVGLNVNWVVGKPLKKPEHPPEPASDEEPEPS